jgi:hypothetical protein
MGTEIFSFFLFIPILFYILNILGLRSPINRRKALYILIINTLFLSYFCISGLIDGYFMQSLMFASLLFVPFQLVTLAITSVLLKYLPSKSESSETVT